MGGPKATSLPIHRPCFIIRGSGQPRPPGRPASLGDRCGNFGGASKRVGLHGQFRIASLESARSVRAGDPVIQPVLDIRDLSVSFMTHKVEIPAVIDFGCTVMPGEIVGLVGESGCGKSTVALAVMRYLGAAGRIAGGEIRFLGEDVVQMPKERLQDLRGSQISMVYQEPGSSLNPSMAIGQQLAEVLIVHENATRSEALRQAREMLEAVRLPDPERLMRSYPHQISGGQQQRVVIAMALLSRPKLLLMDEPTTSLDVTVEAGIIDLVKDLTARFGVSILFISHNLGLVRSTCDRVVVMYSGEVVESGSTSLVFERPRHPYTLGLLRSLPAPDANKNARVLQSIPGQLPPPNARPPGCNFGPRCLHFVSGTCDTGSLPLQSARTETGHETRCIRFSSVDWQATVQEATPIPVSPAGNPVFRIVDLTKHFPPPGGWLGSHGGRKWVKANESVSFEARKGGTVALVGESGCGKSTVARILTGLEVATSGIIQYRGTNIGSMGVRKRKADIVRNIQMVFQNPFDTLNPKRTVGAQVLRVLKKFRIGRNGTERRQRMRAVLDSMKLSQEYTRRKPRQLSGGQKQRVAIARAFVGNPEVVVADEPLSALDASVQAAVAELLMQIQVEQGTTMLFISHDLGLVHHVADWIVVMYLGHIVEQGRTVDVFAPPYHPYTEALLSAAPVADTRVRQKRIVLEGEIPSAQSPPPGCPFQTRCPRKAAAESIAGIPICATTMPPVREFAGEHRIKCHLPDAVLRAMDPVIVVRDGEKEESAPVQDGASR